MEKPFSSEASQKERARVADLSNNEILAMYQPITARFSEDLKHVLEVGDTKRLEELGILAALHTEMLSKWIDALGQYGSDANLLILLDYFSETTEDILAALEREEGVEEDDDDDPSEAWKKGGE